jgi:MFS superfamily sulfate permease-like transporter
LHCKLRGAALPVPLILLVLRRILLAGVNVTLLLLAGLSRLSALLTMLALVLLTALLVLLPLAVLAALLLIFVHIVCHLFTPPLLQRTRFRAAAELLLASV